MEIDEGNKRRRVPAGDGDKQSHFRRDEAAFEVGKSWKALVLRLGEQSSEFDGVTEPKEQLTLCLTLLQRNFDAIKVELLQLIVDCVEELPHKAPFYVTLVGLLNSTSDEFGSSFVEHVGSGLQAAMETGEQHKLRILLRIAAIMARCSLVSPSDVLHLFSLLVTTATAHIDPKDANCNASWQPRSDSFVFSVMAALPFFVDQASASSIEPLLSLLLAYMSLRTPLPSASSAVFLPPSSSSHNGTSKEPAAMAAEMPDYLEDLWSRINAAVESAWEMQGVPTPHSHFPELHSAQPQHTLGPFTLPPPPPHPPSTSPSPSPSSSLVLSDKDAAARKQLIRLRSEFPPRLNRLRLFSPAKTDADLAPIDRFLLEEYLLDVLLYLNGSRKECARYLVNLPVPFRYEHILAETVFAEMLRLPQPQFRPIYYTVVFIDLCKALPGAFPSVLAAAVRVLFNRAPLLDAEALTRVVHWLAHHLSNFAFVWPWPAWSAIVHQPEWSPQRLFVCEVLKREMRLAYFDKVRESLGSEEMEALLPPRPTVGFKYRQQLLHFKDRKSERERERERERGERRGQQLVEDSGAARSGDAMQQGRGGGGGGADGGSSGGGGDGGGVDSGRSTQHEGGGIGSSTKENGSEMMVTDEGEREGDGHGNGDGGGGGSVKSEGDRRAEAAAAAAAELIGLVKSKRSSKEVMEWVDGTLMGALTLPATQPMEGGGGGGEGEAEQGRKAAVDVVMSVMLYLGAASITHTVTLLERYGSVLQQLAPNEVGQMAVVRACAEAWRLNSQMAAIAIDRCMRFRVVQPRVIVDWVFSQDNYSTYHVSDHAWEVLRNALGASRQRTLDIEREVQAAQKEVAIAAAAAAAAIAKADLGDMEGAMSVESVDSAQQHLAQTQQLLATKQSQLETATSEELALLSHVLSCFVTVVNECLLESEHDENQSQETLPFQLQGAERREWERTVLGHFRWFCRYNAAQLCDMKDEANVMLRRSNVPSILGSMKEVISSFC